MACTALLVSATKLIMIMIVDTGTFLQELHVQVYSSTTSCTLLTDYCSEIVSTAVTTCIVINLSHKKTAEIKSTSVFIIQTLEILQNSAM